MKTSKTSKYITVPILNDEYKVVVCIDTPENGYKKVLKYYDNDTDYIKKDELRNCRGKCFFWTDRQVFIWVDSRLKTKYSTLAHEACHAVKHIFDFIGERSIDEVFAHSVGAIVRAVEK